MSEQQRSTGATLGEQFEQVRQRVMESETVKRVLDSEPVRIVQERIQTQGPELIERVKALAAEAMVRRISIQQDGRTLFEFPLALGLGGALLVPQLAALGAVAALVSNCTITVEREESGGSSGAAGPTGSTGSESTSESSSGTNPTA